MFYLLPFFSHSPADRDSKVAKSSSRIHNCRSRVFIERCTVIENSSAIFALGDHIKHIYYDKCLIVIQNRDCDHKNRFHVTVQLLTAIDPIMLEN